MEQTVPPQADPVGESDSWDHVTVLNWLRRLLLGKAGRPADLITGVVGREKDGGWSVFFISDGLEPADVRAWTLTEVGDAAAAAVAAAYAKHPPVEGAELQLAIYPWNYRGGAIFDIGGQPGSYSARDIQGSDASVQGATLEDLVSAVERMPGMTPDKAMFRWIRPIASLPVPPASPLA
jgi:hypothetical protein